MLQLAIPLSYHRLQFAKRLSQQCLVSVQCYTTQITVDALEIFANDLLRRHKQRVQSTFNGHNFSLQFMKVDHPKQGKDILCMSVEELDAFVVELSTKNKDKQLTEAVTECLKKRKSFSDSTLQKLFRNSSVAGKVDVVIFLQRYSLQVDPFLYKRNGEYLHYVAKAQCMKGNSEKGLSILNTCYSKYIGLRNIYRTVLSELIQDSVLNRSEASLVIFRKYLLQFSEIYNDHYPLVCFWHICWSSTWFSDQTLSDELLESSTFLQNIVRDKATVFSINILREYNDDAVVRLLQSLLKYKMMDEYVKVLQVLFAYKLRGRDLQGCTAIIRNCEALGLSLSPSQQGKYIKMLIRNTLSDGKPTKPELKNFKLKF